MRPLQDPFDRTDNEHRPRQAHGAGVDEPRLITSLLCAGIVTPLNTPPMSPVTFGNTWRVVVESALSAFALSSKKPLRASGRVLISASLQKNGRCGGKRESLTGISIASWLESRSTDQSRSALRQVSVWRINGGDGRQRKHNRRSPCRQEPQSHGPPD